MKSLVLFFLHTRTRTHSKDKVRAVEKEVCVSVCVCVPCDSELDEVHQVPVAVTDGADLKSLSLTGAAPGGHRMNRQSSTECWEFIVAPPTEVILSPLGASPMT